MKIILPLAALVSAAPAAAETRNYSVTGFERIRVEGPFAVTLTNNVAPFARATGSLRAIDGVTIRVEGATLVIQANRSAWGGGNTPAGPVTIAVGTHDLRQASVSGTGSLAIDMVKGLEFSLGLLGTGQGSVARADVDRFKLALVGSGNATLAGKAKNFTATVRGGATLDATALQATDATITAMGPAKVQASVKNEATVTASGTAAVTLTGGPSCTLKASGSATVSGCD